MTYLRRWIVASGLLLAVAAIAIQSWDRAPARTDKTLDASNTSSPAPGTASDGQLAGRSLPATAPAQRASVTAPSAASADRASAADVGASAAMRDYG